MTNNQKLFLIVAGFVIWGVFAFLGKTPALDYISAIRDGLLSLGIYHTTRALPPKE